jgi:hypothetical protein
MLIGKNSRLAQGTWLKKEADTKGSLFEKLVLVIITSRKTRGLKKAFLNNFLFSLKFQNEICV